jgi:hypothetical protein
MGLYNVIFSLTAYAYCANIAIPIVFHRISLPAKRYTRLGVANTDTDHLPHNLLRIFMHGPF